MQDVNEETPAPPELDIQPETPAPADAPAPAAQDAPTVGSPEPPQPDPLDQARAALREAQRQAAAALRELALRTETEIVPELVQGETPEEVQASIERSRAAFRAALAHIHRTLPPAPAPAPQAQSESANPIDLIARGLQRK